MTHASQSIWARELDDLLRGVAGALLFGVPLLYTMEVWWIGNSVTPLRMLVGLALTYLALVALNRSSGFRRGRQSTFGRSLLDSGEALALGLAVSTASLFLLRRITGDISLHTALGHIVLESIPFSIGVGIANGLLNRAGGDEDEQEDGADDEGEQPTDGDQPEQPDEQPTSLWKDTLADAGGTALGATIIAFSIAPTDEVPMIAGALSPMVLMLVVAASLLVSYVIVFEAEFGNQQARQDQRGVFQTPLSETIASYCISLVLTMAMLVFFKQLTLEAPLNQWVSHTITLGLPATIGGAAGRLAV
jgi:putative integral membrane protein (TIGR02587 family)